MIWSMFQFRISSVGEHVRTGDVTVVMRVLTRAEMMGVPLPDNVRIDRALFGRVVRSLHEAGIARSVPAELPASTISGAGDWTRAWADVAEAIEASPHPAGEWRPALELLGDGLLSSLVSIHPSSVRRYASAERATPDAVAARLHEVGRIVSALAGSYNEYGLRRWFDRPRPQLDGHAPRELLRDDWSPDDPDVRRVVALAEALLGAGAAT